MTVPDRDRAVCVVGAGYVGIVTAAGLASLGRDVRIVEIDAARWAAIAAGRAPIHEPGLDAALAEQLRAGRLRLATDLADGLRGAGIAVVAVGTPPTAEGDADLAHVRTAVAGIAVAAEPGTVVVIKSTVPPGTVAALARSIGPRLPVVMCPEFLREGSALHDLHHPARLVVGGDDPDSLGRVAGLFAELGGELIVTDATSAELIKYGTNAFLALKISFINEIAELCELTGGNVDAVAHGMGLDPRVGRAFLNAGLGFGGSCFPKDVRALEATAGYHGQSFWMLKAAIEVNAQQRRRFVNKIRLALGGSVSGRRIAVLGLAFKPGTDDLRQAPALDIIRHLEDQHAQVVATDPAALERARPLLPATELVADAMACVAGADAVVLVTEWDEFRSLDWARVAESMAGNLVVDGRNCLDGERLAALGLRYRSVGRPPIDPLPLPLAAEA
ncbi:MAG TPA: UDP-glucose/GDP-mannose dehydrogenase family protein [Candidatus Dormibacteraeota bacterium]